MKVLILFLVLSVLSHGTSETVSVDAHAWPGPQLPTVSVVAAEPSGTPWRLSRRSKRCSCSSFLDNECIYFCHLDIIWINTPERTVPYGLGNPSRIKRSLKATDPGRLLKQKSRCQCNHHKDQKCLQFCQAGTELWAQMTQGKLGHQLPENQDCTGQGLKCVYQQLVNHVQMKQSKQVNGNTRPSMANTQLKNRPSPNQEWKLFSKRKLQRKNVWDRLKAS